MGRMKRSATAELRLASKTYSKMVAISTFALGRNSALNRRIALGPLRFRNERCDMRVDFLKGKARNYSDSAFNYLNMPSLRHSN
jgi:hypothetical protein